MTNDSLIDRITKHCKECCDPRKPREAWILFYPEVLAIIREHMGDASTRKDEEKKELDL